LCPFQGNFWMQKPRSSSQNSVSSAFNSLYSEDIQPPLAVKAPPSRRSGADTETELAQINMGLNTARPSRIFRLKDEIRRWENILELLPFWRQPLNPVNIAFSVLTVIFGAGLIYSNFDKLPGEVSFIYSQLQDKWLNSDKTLLALLPVGFAIVQVVLLRLNREIFNFDRRLSLVMAAIQIFANAVLLIGLIQILSLKLV